MEQNERPDFGGTFATIAWAQLLVGVTVVQREDLRKLSALWTEATSGKAPWAWDFTPFGSLAIALNVAAIVFLTSASLQERAQPPEHVRRNSDLLGASGFACWYASAVGYLLYLNPAFLLFGVGAFVPAYLVLRRKNGRR